MRAAHRRFEREYERDMILAYNTAGLHRTAKFPKLDKLLGKKIQPKISDRQQAISYFKAMSAHLKPG